LPGRFISARYVAKGDNWLDVGPRVACGYIMKQIRYTKSAIKALRRMSVNTAKLIRTKIEASTTERE
jgi:hypothetical protein